jgi:hypothetical protein
MPRIVSIVEGEGEQAAVPILIRRIGERLGVYHVEVHTTVATKRNRFPRFASERERAMATARLHAGETGAILVMLDSDGEPPCVDSRHRLSPCVLGEDLLREIEPLAAGLPVAVVMAEREFEAWLVAAAPSLIGPRGLNAGVAVSATPDSLRDPKGWLSLNMADPDRNYGPTADQARFTERFDIDMARDNSGSFRRCYEEIERLILAVCQP